MTNRNAFWAASPIVLTLVAAGCLLVFAVSIFAPHSDKSLLGYDGMEQYLYLRSALLDGDIVFNNEYIYYIENGYFPTTLGRLEIETFTDGPDILGNWWRQYPVGMAVVWLPAFLIAHLVTVVVNASGYLIEPNGYTIFYEIAVNVETMLLAYVGILYSYHFARQFFEYTEAVVATLSVWLATNLIYYMTGETTMSHNVSLAGIAAFLYYWDKSRGERSYRQWALLGGIIGLTTMIRWQEGLFFLPILFVETIFQIQRRRLDRKWLTGLALFAVTAFIVFIPQMVAWKITLGQFITYPRTAGFMSWTNPQMGKVLFSMRHGWITWTPLVGLALIGLLIFSRKNQLLGILFFVIILIQVYINGALPDWWGAQAFGQRRLINTTPILILGVAALLERTKPYKLVRYLTIGLVAVLILWNGLFMIQYRFGFIPLEEAITWHDLTWGKFEVLGLLWKKVVS